jgi:N-methylhydantoinase A
MVELPGVEGGGRYMVGVDVGGTFTDLVLVDDRGNVTIEKVPSTPADMSEGVLDGLTRAGDRLQLGDRLVRSLDRFVHGTTIAANAFLERKGAHIGFLTTKGLRDTLVMRRMFRENMYDTRVPEPAPLVSRDDIFEVDERMDRSGAIVRPLDDAQVRAIAAQIVKRKIQAVGICFIFSFRNPAHELRVKRILEETIPGLYISASCEVCPEIRDYERACTTHLNAYLQPPVDRYLRHLDLELREHAASVPLQIMQSYGGVTGAADSAKKPVNLLLSGPAGGVIGSAHWGRLTGHPDVISFDMGGTSADISLVADGIPSLSTPITATATHCKFQGWDVLIPFIDIHTIGSGGGSVAWIDDAGGLHVGPRSVGAVPGPACYGKGGDIASVTDADLLLGYINPDYYLGGRIRLDVAKAHDAVRKVADRLQYSVIEAAEGIFRIVNATMINGLRVVSVEKGHDPRKFALMSFGGAAAIHTTALMDELGVERVIIPPGAAAFSAFGLLCTDLRHDYVSTMTKMVSDLDLAEVNRALGEMETQGRADLGVGQDRASELRFEYAADMRYQGQAHEIRVPLTAPVRSLRQVIDAFNAAYERSYGYLLEEEGVQVVNLRAFAFVLTAKPTVTPAPESGTAPGGARKGERAVHFREAGGFIETPLYDGDQLAPGARIVGPAVVELSSTNVVVRPGQELHIDRYRNFIVERGGRQQ